MMTAMQHVAKVLACLDPDGASPEEWDELLHAQAVWIGTDESSECLLDRLSFWKPFFQKHLDAQESMERAVLHGLLPAEFIDDPRHAFNTPSERHCDCDVIMDVDLLCHQVGCRLMTLPRQRMAYVTGARLTSESQVFHMLMRSQEVMVADNTLSQGRRVLWCPRNSVIDRRATGAMPIRETGLWARSLSKEMIAIGVPPVSFSSLDPGPYTALEIGQRVHAEFQAELAARPTFT